MFLFHCRIYYLLSIDFQLCFENVSVQAEFQVNKLPYKTLIQRALSALSSALWFSRPTAIMIANKGTFKKKIRSKQNN